MTLRRKLGPQRVKGGEEECVRVPGIFSWLNWSPSRRMNGTAFSGTNSSG